MLATALTEIKGLVDARLFLSAFLPVLVVALGLVALLAEARGGVAAVSAGWEQLTVAVQLALVGAFLSAVFLGAVFLHHNVVVLVRLYEGYLLRPEWLRERGRERQQARRDGRRRQAPGTQAEHRASLEPELWYPRDNIQPTALGNILRAAEDHPRRAYGIDSVTVWPRLYHLLPPEFVTSMTGVLGAVQFLLTVSALSAFFAVAGGAYVAFRALGTALFLLTVAGGAALSVMAYRMSLEPAIEYGLHFRAAFDLYRSAAVTQLGAAAPTTPEEEQRLWAALSAGLQHGEPQLHAYAVEPDD